MVSVTVAAFPLLALSLALALLFAFEAAFEPGFVPSPLVTVPLFLLP